MTVIALAAQKGGVGKTTTTLNLGVSLHQLGRRILLIDLDPQASLTIHCRYTRPETLSGLAEVFLGRIEQTQERHPSLQDVILHTPLGIDLAPANQGLLAAASLLNPVPNKQLALRDILAPVRGSYDYILIDCPPTLGLLTQNALAASDYVIIPTNADYLAVESLPEVVRAIGTIKKNAHPGLEILGVLLNMVDFRTFHSRLMIAQVREMFHGRARVFDSIVPARVRLKDASKKGEGIVTYDANDHSAQVYRLLAAEVDNLVLSAGPRRLSVAMTETETEVPLNGVHEDTLEKLRLELPTAQGALGPGPVSHGGTGEAPDLPGYGATWEEEAFVATARCSRLGFLANPDEWLEELSEDHRCFASGSPHAMTLEVQKLYCLVHRHTTCPRYFRRADVDPKAKAPSASKEGKPTGRGSGGRWRFWARDQQ